MLVALTVGSRVKWCLSWFHINPRIRFKIIMIYPHILCDSISPTNLTDNVTFKLKWCVYCEVDSTRGYRGVALETLHLVSEPGMEYSSDAFQYAAECMTDCISIRGSAQLRQVGAGFSQRSHGFGPGWSCKIHDRPCGSDVVCSASYFGLPLIIIIHLSSSPEVFLMGQYRIEDPVSGFATSFLTQSFHNNDVSYLNTACLVLCFSYWICISALHFIIRVMTMLHFFSYSSFTNRNICFQFALNWKSFSTMAGEISMSKCKELPIVGTDCAVTLLLGGWPRLTHKRQIIRNFQDGTYFEKIYRLIAFKDC